MSGHPSDSHVLRDYALIADGSRGAVIGPRGDIAWLCVPYWDSPSVFSTLIGGDGTYSITPRGRFVWSGAYEDGTLIWKHRWVTETGLIECRDALAYPGDAHCAVILRQIHAIDADAELDVVLAPRARYDREPPSEVEHRHGTWMARIGNLHMRWQVGPGVRAQDGEFALRLKLARGQRHELCLELSDRPLPAEPPDGNGVWTRTALTWQDAVPRLEDGLNSRDSRRHYAVLRGLTSPNGGMVAAATTSLPESTGAGRNYDYRYVWIRDQCYAAHAVAAQGEEALAGGLLDDAVRFITERLLADGPKLSPAYTTRGEPVPAPQHLQLPGYPGGANVIGNRVRRQFQLDGFGEALSLFAAAAAHGRLNSEAWKAMGVAADAVTARWSEPDAGMWEIDDRAWTHSRLTASAGLRAAAAAVAGRSTEVESGPRERAADWLVLADRILADTARTSLHADGRWQRSPEDPAVDAALLLPGLRGAVPADDPRCLATLDAYLRDLTADGYAYRFRQDGRDLTEAEGSFLLCGFLVALSAQSQGRAVEARAWFERTNAACGSPGLFSEEYDASLRQQRGNLPQAFVHALALEASARLSRPW